MRKGEHRGAGEQRAEAGKERGKKGKRNFVKVNRHGENRML